MIFVTGAAGFVGRHLVERLLEAGYPVRVLVSPRKANALPKWASHPNVEIVVGVLSDEETLYRALIGVHVVFHLASAQWWGRRRDLERVELVGDAIPRGGGPRGARRADHRAQSSRRVSVERIHAAQRERAGRGSGEGQWACVRSCAPAWFTARTMRSSIISR
ncbi:MAG: NAD(P)H-binding protein [Chloroflexi bacterium]|nr:NAD(P)H-binding protein [Chloroflexota bacterium]